MINNFAGSGSPAVKSVLILGIGNISRMDDGIGIHVVNHIFESGMSIPQNVEIIDGGMSLYDLLPVMMNREKIIIVDALKSDDNPGTIYRFPAEYLIRTGVKDIIDQVYIASGKIDIEIVGIVPENTDSECINISDSLKKIIDVAAMEVLKAAGNSFDVKANNCN